MVGLEETPARPCGGSFESGVPCNSSSFVFLVIEDLLVANIYLSYSSNKFWLKAVFN